MKKLYDTRLIPLDILAKPNQQVVVKCIKNTITRKVGYIALWEEVWGHINKTFWEPQRLVITSNEPVGSGWYIDDCNLIRKSVTDDADYWAVRKHYKKVEATYPSMREIGRIDIADVMKWVKERCPNSVELEVYMDVDYDYVGENSDGRAQYAPVGENLRIVTNPVKMVWVEPFVDERQYLKEEREYNETGYREEEEQTERPQQVAGANKTYEERLNEIAEEMAKANISTWDKLPAIIQGMHINQWKASADIALERMAAGFLKGYESGVYDANGEDKPLPLSQQLQLLGLIKPKK
jgi:hypothetical protein